MAMRGFPRSCKPKYAVIKPAWLRQLGSGGMSTELLEQRSQPVELDPESAPVPGLQLLQGSVIVAESLARAIGLATCGRRPRRCSGCHGRGFPGGVAKGVCLKF